MKIKVFIILMILFSLNSFLVLADIDKYYQIDISNSNGLLNVTNVKVELGRIPNSTSSFGDKLLVINSFYGEILYQTFFETIGNSIVEGDLGNGYLEGQMIFYNISKIKLQIPYYSNAEEIVIYDNNYFELSRKGISEFSKEVPKIENISKTPEGGKETGKKETPTENLTDKIARYWWILIIVLAVLIAYLAYSITRKR